VAAVVAWVPLGDPEGTATQLAALRTNPLVVGVRNLIHTLPDPDWLLRAEVDESLGILERAGVTLDFVGELPRHLEIVPIIAARHPELRIVIDHLNKPPIGLESRDPWWSLIAAAAESPMVFGKVSGLYSATGDMAAWSVEGIRPFFERAVEVFGAERLMYGGDWPISVLAGGYDRVWDGLSVLFAELGDADRERVLGGTAAEFYGISR
jgi:L-fuconolactonase